MLISLFVMKVGYYCPSWRTIFTSIAVVWAAEKNMVWFSKLNTFGFGPNSVFRTFSFRLLTERLNLRNSWRCECPRLLMPVYSSSYLLCSHYKGAADKNAQPLAFVGKGITFDSGGISLKPGAVCKFSFWVVHGLTGFKGMKLMRGDMGAHALGVH